MRSFVPAHSTVTVRTEERACGVATPVLRGAERHRGCSEELVNVTRTQIDNRLEHEVALSHRRELGSKRLWHSVPVLEAVAPRDIHDPTPTVGQFGCPGHAEYPADGLVT